MTPSRELVAEVDEISDSEIELERVVEIEGKHYRIQAMSPSKAFKLATRIAKIIAEPLGAMAVAGKDVDKVQTALKSAMKALGDNIDEVSTWDIVSQVLATVTSIENKVLLSSLPAVEALFRGRLGHMMKVVSEAMDFHFRDFFEAIAQEYRGAEEKAETKGA